jgi:hypothetical protein
MMFPFTAWGVARRYINFAQGKSDRLGSEGSWHDREASHGRGSKFDGRSIVCHDRYRSRTRVRRAGRDLALEGKLDCCLCKNLEKTRPLPTVNVDVKPVKPVKPVKSDKSALVRNLMRLKVQIVDELRLKKPERPTSGVKDWNVAPSSTESTMTAASAQEARNVIVASQGTINGTGKVVKLSIPLNDNMAWQLDYCQLTRSGHTVYRPIA